MSDLPPTIDAILDSIRARVTAEAEPKPQTPPAKAPKAAKLEAAEPASDMGAMVVPAMTLEALMRQMLEPMLKQWLDERLPEIVERATQAEIKRLSGRG
jgi:cell pole-organizing protein PopZ